MVVDRPVGLGGERTVDDGWPINQRGVVETASGLYLVGMPFQYGLTSGIIGGVGCGAACVVDRLAAA